MITSRVIRGQPLAVCFSLVAGSAFAQTGTRSPFEPQSGQAGKDVVWVPTPQALVDKMLDMAKVTPQDFVMDLGSGDGRTVITAAKRGATGDGRRIQPRHGGALEAERRQRRASPSKATFVKADLFETDFSKATVITMFLLPQINLKLRPKILDLKPGTRIVSNSFTMDDWEADETATVTEDCTSWCTALLWIVPAKVDGTWTTPQGDLVLKQQFQMVTGTLGGKPITDGRLRGDELTFTAGGTQHTGKVSWQDHPGRPLDGDEEVGPPPSPSFGEQLRLRRGQQISPVLSLTRTLLAALAGACAALAALAAFTLYQPAIVLDMDVDLPRAVTSGFYPVERTKDETFVWTTPLATVTLRGIDRDAEWVCYRQIARRPSEGCRSRASRDRHRRRHPADLYGGRCVRGRQRYRAAQAGQLFGVPDHRCDSALRTSR